MRVVSFAVAAAVTLLVSLTQSASGPALAQESQLDSLRAAARSNPKDPAGALTLGRALRRAGRFPEALTELRRAAAVGASDPDALLRIHWEVARVHMDRHDFRQAMSECGVLGRLHGYQAQSHACAADAHLAWQRGTEALTETATALSIDPRSYEAKIAQGRAQELALDIAKSELSFREAIAWQPERPEGHLGLGRVLSKRGLKDSALAELRKGVQLDPDGPDALYELAMALSPGTERATLLERATRERPSFAEAWLALGAQQIALGHFVQARRAADAALRIDATSVGPHLLRGKVALADKRADDAIKEGEAALQLLANSAPAQLLVADGYAASGEIDRALEAYQAAYGLDHADPTPLVHASELCHTAGRDTSARAFGLKATQDFPDWGPGWAALGDALAGQGEKRAAREAYAKALAAAGPVDADAVQKKLATLR
jgi:tetratricopeptide (TPR) repeat protein